MAEKSLELASPPALKPAGTGGGPLALTGFWNLRGLALAPDLPRLVKASATQDVEWDLREIAALDWLYCSDSFGFKFGGDGDNGEHLIYLLDILFDLQDAERQP